MECQRFGHPALTRECRLCSRRIECFERQALTGSVFLLLEHRPVPPRKPPTQTRYLVEDPVKPKKLKKPVKPRKRKKAE